MSAPIIDVIIPAFNEQEAVGLVVGDIPKGLVRHIVVVNNASSDKTSEMARAAGAIVVDQPMRGYGNACLKGIAQVASHEPPPDIVAFIDADNSDNPEQMTEVVAPIVEGRADFVIGSRALGHRDAGSMMPQQIFGNWIATRLLKLFYGVKYTDLGPFRAVRWEALQAMGMRDRTFGWTVEMQLKAAKQGLRIVEVPVDYRKRIGFSKISGTVKGSVLAGWKIITTIIKYR
ncbi:MAG: glycosyltransferase family 2 protein [Flavobacteriales bacterium]|jgi:glycosyltransferase involved in cell wall biosynthesis|nr:glycosyltransferase family 2 protein [Flavobacteriales bacterium]MCB0758737.1 glycosyltransferase family 2 protein [Flavobacteriales bacterium]